ncbi:hypothetical protein L493_3289 [Bordetella bronchiseptica 99-R-0433]|nr:hypothetical protein L493_3289 [Bordetella bronchiseptica 99-R-0433]
MLSTVMNATAPASRTTLPAGPARWWAQRCAPRAAHGLGAIDALDLARRAMLLASYEVAARSAYARAKPG